MQEIDLFQILADLFQIFLTSAENASVPGLFIILLFYPHVCLLVKHPLGFSCSRQSNRPGDKILNDIELLLPSAYGFVLMMSFGQFQRCQNRGCSLLEGCLCGLCQGLSSQVPCSHHYLHQVKRRGQESPKQETPHILLYMTAPITFFILWFFVLFCFVCLLICSVLQVAE